MEIRKLSPDNAMFLKRVTDEISGTVLMLSEETGDDLAKLGILQSELLRHALIVAEVIFGGDNHLARTSIRNILTSWERMK